MNNPTPIINSDERALLECIGGYGGASPPYSLPLSSVCEEFDMSEVHLRTIVWNLRDPRRFTAELVVFDERFSPTLVRLTPEGLQALAGDVPVQPSLLTGRPPPSTRPT